VSTAPQLSPEAVAQALTTLGVPADKAAAAAAGPVARRTAVIVKAIGVPLPHQNPVVMAAWCETHGLPVPVAEYVFAPPRHYMADWCWLAERVILEIDGWRDHSSRKGWLRDQAKGNLAQVRGFVFLRTTVKQLYTAPTAYVIREALALQLLRAERRTS